MNNNNGSPSNKSISSGTGIWTAIGVAGGVATIAGTVGGLYYHYNQKSAKKTESNQNNSEISTKLLQKHRQDSENRQAPTVVRTDPAPSDSASSSYLSNIIKTLETSISTNSVTMDSRKAPPDNPTINNLNALLDDIYRRYIQLNDDALQQHYYIFNTIFLRLHEAMKDVDPYYKKYSSTVQYAGSHFDRLRIQKLDMFPDEDVDIVIGLPLNFRQHPLDPNESDIVIEAKSPGFIQLKMGTQFQRLLMRDGQEWTINKTAYEWKDDKNYLLRSKFSNWFKSVVIKALNKFGLGIDGRRFIFVDNVSYTVETSESGPAMTLLIKDRAKNFNLDVDLVPALRFPENRWPVCKPYREIPPGCGKDYWMVVPKPNKGALNDFDTLRSWRIALHNQERQMLHGTNHLRQSVRLIKKLRDSLGMEKIASYYIKTLFLMQVAEVNDLGFWSRNNPATLFKIMVKKLHSALVDGEIPYFWNKKNNLIGAIDKGILRGYAAKVSKLMSVLDSEKPGDYKLVAQYLLSDIEYAEYKMKVLRI